jgi:hypothetical protein
MDAECLCCTLTRGVALGFGLGLIAAAFMDRDIIEIASGLVIVVVVVTLSAITDKKEEQS